MEERTYTKSELYQFVAEYAKEANDEGFDMSVGDFVGWVASREEKKEGDADIIDCDPGVWACSGCGFLNSHSPECKNPLIIYLRKPVGQTETQGKPVLPEKLSENYEKDWVVSDWKLVKTINSLIDYLSRKEQ